MFCSAAAWAPKPGAADALARLRAAAEHNDIVLGVASNNDGRLPRVLDALGLKEPFDFVLTSVECGAEKPLPPIFTEARARAAGGGDGDALAPHECVHVGDCLERDVKGALAAGHHAVWLNVKGAPTTQCDAFVEEFCGGARFDVCRGDDDFVVRTVRTREEAEAQANYPFYADDGKLIPSEQYYVRERPVPPGTPTLHVVRDLAELAEVL